MAEEINNINQDYNSASVGMNMDSLPSNIKKGTLTYALNATLWNFDADGVAYQNEPGNELCLTFPEGYVVIGKHFINEQNKHIFFLTNPATSDCQIGYMANNDCVYHVILNSPCLNFDVNHPIHKVVHKISNCSTEIYWTDGLNPRRYLDLENVPMVLSSGTPFYNPSYTDDVDCNKLRVQPSFSVPIISIQEVISGGNLTAGTYQFAIQYADALGNPYTSYYSITNPTPIADVNISSVNFDYNVNKAIAINISNLDISGIFQYFNLAVLKTINGITSVELVGTYFIDDVGRNLTYTGQNVTNIRLSIADIFEKFPFYDIAGDVTYSQDVLIWDQLTSIDRINYQHIANQIQLQWETWRIPSGETYADEYNATNLRSYLRDEVYPFEIAFILSTGKETDGFHIPGRESTMLERTLPAIADTSDDFVGEPDYYLGGVGYSPYWRIYNTATVSGNSPLYSSSPDYKGAYQYGEFAYWESTETYPENAELWGELSGKKIRHHKFPDVNVSPIFESKTFTSIESLEMGDQAIFPIGIRVNVPQIRAIIENSDLTREQKDDVVGFKILRGDRGTNKSIVAKGILRNVNSYEREDQTYYFANYPYNDLNDDAFINSSNNAYVDSCDVFNVEITELDYDPTGGANFAQVDYIDCNTGKSGKKKYTEIGTYPMCSIGKPHISYGGGNVTYLAYDLYSVASEGTCRGWRVEYNDITEGITTKWVHGYLGSPRNYTLRVVVGTEPVCVEGCDHCGIYINKIRTVEAEEGDCTNPQSISGVDGDLKYRLVFNSPETSFGQPYLGNILKLESVIYGKGVAHFTQVKDNAKYKLISREAQIEALDSATDLANDAGPDIAVLFSAYESYLKILTESIPWTNFAYSFNSIANYDYSATIDNGLGIKQRNVDLIRYLLPGVQSIGDEHVINNYQRESSVYLRTDLNKDSLLFPSDSPNMLAGTLSLLKDYSRFTISEKGNCDKPGKDEEIRVVSYYASIKNDIKNQWGQIYSYETIDTGYNGKIDDGIVTVFGGDTFIGRFAFKTKLPFFIDNRVGAPDGSDVFYDEIGNIGYPKYWHSARSINEDYSAAEIGILPNIVSYKAHNFDCANDTLISDEGESTTTTSTTATPTAEVTFSGNYYDGYYYLFAYGVPNFYCESSYNLDLRQAFNNKEGDFWPHVSTSVPDDWVQEKFVSIANDNTYYYNTTFSKQNKENTFTHLPPDWVAKMCYTHYPFRAIYSDAQNTDADNRINSWLIYRALSYYDFPQNYGSLISLDGIENHGVLARFENKSLLYNRLLTIDTNNPQAAYVGNQVMFKQSPPIDFADTDIGYVGSQHKMLLRVPGGQITIDAKRGQIFFISGTEIQDISAYGSGMNKFLTNHLSFEITKSFPTVNIDNHFNGIGLHGVYDAKNDRIIITKIDYIPLSDDIKYDEDTHEFYIESTIETIVYDCNFWATAVVDGTTTTTTSTTSLTTTTTTTTTDSPGRETSYTYRTVISLEDDDYFCNRSWTLSFNLVNKAWISFHSYIPNWYIAENNFFYSGKNGCCDGFEFDFISNVLIADPTTTTTTSTSTSTSSTTSTTSTSTTSTTTSTSTSTSTTTTTTTACQRPSGLDFVGLIAGYEITSPSATYDSTGSSDDACEAMNLLELEDPSNISPVFVYAQLQGLSIGSEAYLSNGSNDCTCVPDGWYFTEETLNYGYVFHIESCEITEIVYCEEATTTTTTTSSTSSTTTTTTTFYALSCGELFEYSGGLPYHITREVVLGSATGNCIFTYNAFSTPDRFIVTWNSGVEIDTGYVGDSSCDFGGANRAAFNASLYGEIDPITSNPYPDLGTYADDGYPRVSSPGYGVDVFNKTAASPANATVDVYAPMAGSVWEYMLNCPGVTTTTTTTTEAPTTTTTTTSSSSTTTTTSTTAAPIYRYVISNQTYTDCADACSTTKEVPVTDVWSSESVGSLTTLYLDAELTTPYAGLSGYHWLRDESTGNYYCVRTSGSSVITVSAC